MSRIAGTFTIALATSLTVVAAGAATPAAAVTAPIGDHVKTIPNLTALGQPVGPETAWAAAGSGYAQRFEKGWALIRSTQKGGAVVGTGGIVTGELLLYFNANGYVNAVGWPAGNAMTDAQGTWQHFDSTDRTQYGALMSSAKGTFPVKYGMYQMYVSGNLRDVLGSATGAETQWKAGGGGAAQRFAKGWATYKSPTAKGYVLDTLTPFPNISALGWPTSGTYFACGTRKVSLEHGYATTNGATCPDDVNLLRVLKASTSVRTAPSGTAATAGTLPADSIVTGEIVNGWMRISTPAQYAGKYLPATAFNTTQRLYTARTGLQVYSSTSTATPVATVPVFTGFLTTFVNSTWAVILDGPYRGRYVLTSPLTTVDPNHIPSGSTTTASSRAPIGQTVTRWVAGFGASPTYVRIHSAAATSSSVVGTVAGGGSLTGQYINSDWFKITSGPYAGKYANAALLLQTSNLSAINGKKAAVDMCQLPLSVADTWEPGIPRYMDCSAAKAFAQMNADYTAKFGRSMKADETYRDFTKQVFYQNLFGYPRASIPGTSNHGFGTAVDFEGYSSAKWAGYTSPYVFDGPADVWLTQNGAKYGFDRPSYLDKTAANPEYWHYNFVG